MIIVKPMSKWGRLIGRFPRPFQKALRAAVGKMPTLFVAYHQNRLFDEVAVVGLRYRRQSHSCELSWWYGRDEELLRACVTAIKGQMLLEGRRRLEANIEEDWDEDNPPSYAYPYHRGGESFVKLLCEKEGFVFEGRTRYASKYFEDVTELSWSPLGVEELFTDMDVSISLGENENTRKYYQKNLEWCLGEREHLQPYNDGRPLYDILVDNRQKVLDNPHFRVIPHWTPREESTF